MENYYLIKVYCYDKNNIVKGQHIIKAESAKKALEIREKHGISNPRFATGNLKIDIFLINDQLDRIERRKQGIGGKIWCEDENGNLINETT
jgi:hypothetical protein